MFELLEHRRRFLWASGAVAGLVFRPCFESVADEQSAKSAPADQDQLITPQGPLRWSIADCELEENGASLRGPSLFPPQQWEIVPVAQRQVIQFKSTTLGESSVDLLFPLPRSLGEIKRLGGDFRVAIQASRKGAPEVAVKLRLLKTVIPFANAFLWATFTVENGQSYTVDTVLVSPLSMPVATKDDQTVQRLLPRYNAARLQATDGVRYNAAIHSRVRLDGQVFSSGDCGIRAAVLKQLTQGACEIAAGWSPRHPATNGMHVWCLGPGNVALDADGIFVNQRDFIPGMIGDRFLYPNPGPFADFPDYTAPNNIVYGALGADVTQTTTMRFSSPKFGPLQAALKSQADKPWPADVQTAHDKFTTERRQINETGGGEKLLAKIPLDRR